MNARFALLAALIATTAACVPVAYKRFDHVRSVGWSRHSLPMALAEDTSVGRTLFVLHPDGPGVYDGGRVHGIVVIEGRRRKIVAFAMPGARRLEVVDAAPRAEGDGFLAIVHADVPAGNHEYEDEERCYVIHVDGSTVPCSESGGVTTWTSTVDFPAVPLRDLPCSVNSGRVSPGGDRLAFACNRSRNGILKAGLWVIGEDRIAGLLAEEDYMPTVVHRVVERPEDTVAESEEEHALAWSPDARRLYWCGGPAAHGILVTFGEPPPLRHQPCLLQASWSEDGTRLVGMMDYKLAVCDVGRDEAGRTALSCSSRKRALARMRRSTRDSP